MNKALLNLMTDVMAKEACKLSRQVYGGLLDTNEWSTQLKRCRVDGDKHAYHKQDKLEKQRGHFPYVSLPAESFLPYVTFAQFAAGRMLEKPLEDVSFIDVGSGIGEKLMWAQEFCEFVNVTGIEYNAWTHSIAVERLGHRPNMTLIHGDAFEHDFSTYDVIYMYCPISREEVMAQLWWHIYQTAKPGALILDTLTPYMREVLRRHPEIIGHEEHRAVICRSNCPYTMYNAGRVMRYRQEDGTMGLLNDTGHEVPLERRL